jgi:ATP-binding cassette subfamily B multidrug efflux pump
MALIMSFLFERIMSACVGLPKDLPIPSKSPPKILWWVLSRRPHIRVYAFLLGLVSATSGVISPWYQRLFVDTLNAPKFMASVANSHEILDWYQSVILQLVGYVFVACIFAVLYQVSISACRILCSRESSIMHMWLARMLYSHALRLDPAVRGVKSVGETVSLYTTDIHAVIWIIEDTLPSLISAVIPLIFAPVAVSLLLNLPIAAPLFASVLFVSVCLLLASFQGMIFRRAKELAEIRLGLVNEWLQNIRALRILGWVDGFEKKLKFARHNETRNRLTMVTNGSTMNSIMQVAPQAINVVAFYYLLRSVDRSITPGDIFSLFWIFGIFLMRPLRMLPWTLVTFLDALTSARRIDEFLSLANESGGGAQGIEQKSQIDEVVRDGGSGELEGVRHEDIANGTIEIRDLHLSLQGRRLLKIESLYIPAGALVGIVGEVGSGKSLLLKSLLRETWASFKSYLIDGEDVLDLPNVELRLMFSYVPQESFIMSSSLRDNVAFEYGTDSALDEKCMSGLHKAQFIPDKERCEMGLNTELGERGVNLSGGQRQRINLARAHLHSRNIVLMDDSLSALDVHTENRICEELILGEWKQYTRIIATHRLSILPYCSTVIFLVNGTIAAMGPHDELVENNEQYKAYIESASKERA